MRAAWLLLIALGLSGCQTPYRLDPRWQPLAEVVERPGLLPADPDATTLNQRVYVPSLRRFLARFPADSPEQEALLLHEREHAVRQLSSGVGPWLARYLNDREFMWAEEQAGWYLQLTHLRQQGRPVDARAVALALSRYRNLSGRMVSFPDALAWVRDVLACRWEP